METKQFVKNLKAILSVGKKQQELIHECGIHALETCNLGKTTGVHSPVQMLWDTVNQLKSINRQAFMQWFEAYGCLRFVTLEDKTKVIKYKEREDALELLEEAKLTPFWEFAKEPTPNLKPFDVKQALMNLVMQAKAAATGGKDGTKPVRKVEHAELLTLIGAVLESPESCKEKLGLQMPSELLDMYQEEEENGMDVFTEDMQHELEMQIERLGLRAA